MSLNDIEEIESDYSKNIWFFSNMNQLRYLYMSQAFGMGFDRCRTFFFNKALEIVDLSVNMLINFPQFCLITTASDIYECQLKEINFSWNWLEELDYKNLREMEKLEILNLEHNKIKKINNDSFRDFINLKVLKLSSNRLFDLDQDSFQFLSNLEYSEWTITI